MSIKFQRKVVKIGGSYRITIPLEIVRAVKIKNGDNMSIWLDNGQIVLGKPENARACVLTRI